MTTISLKTPTAQKLIAENYPRGNPPPVAVVATWLRLLGLPLSARDVWTQLQSGDVDLGQGARLVWENG